MIKENINEIALFIVSIIVAMWIAIRSDAKTIRVLVIDTGIDMSHSEIFSHIKDQWNFNYVDTNGHGTAMAGLIVQNVCPEVEVISCKYYFPWKKYDSSMSNNCFKRALTENIDYINYSSSGDDPNQEESEIIKELTDKGVIIVVAAGNKGKNLTPSFPCAGAYPACYPYQNLYPVQNLMNDGKLHPTSNYLKGNNVRSLMGTNVPVLFPYNRNGLVTGTSPAAAKYTNSLLLQKCKEIHK